MADDKRTIEIIQAVNAAKGKRGAVKELSAKYNLSPSHLYRLGRNAERFAADGATKKGARIEPILFDTIAETGLKHYGGSVQEDYDRVFRTLQDKLAVYSQMSNDPIVAAVMQAITMQIRRVEWYVDPMDDKESKVNEEAAEFLEQVRDDCSQSWLDMLNQSLVMLRDGFSLAELVYKKRQGDQTGKKTTIQIDDGKGGKMAKEIDLASSKYDDGRIGWRKWQYISGDSLSPGQEWKFDDNGGVQGITQSPPPTYKPRAIPIEKLILFRSNIEKGNPESRSILRAMYPAWYMKTNLEEMEAISAERLGAGFPVVYMGDDVSKNPDDPDSHLAQLIDVVRNVRTDEQMGLALPFKKMGTGLSDNKGVLFEFVQPSGTGSVDYNAVITRYEQRMTMVGLAQFIHLGMNSVGARSLGDSFLDFFGLAIEGWLDSIEDTINRFAVDRLFKLNSFPGLSMYPRIKHKAAKRISLAELSGYISQLAGAQIIVPDADLENMVREFADLPPKSLEVVAPPAVPGASASDAGDVTGEVSKGEDVKAADDDVNEPEDKTEKASEKFYNENHDESGRFASGGGGVSGGGNGGISSGRDIADTTFYHLTSERGEAGILSSGEINLSNGLLGKGVYLTLDQKGEGVVASGAKIISVKVRADKIATINEKGTKGIFKWLDENGVDGDLTDAAKKLGVDAILIKYPPNSKEPWLFVPDNKNVKITDTHSADLSPDLFYNENHDEQGRFASGGGGGGGGRAYGEWGVSSRTGNLSGYRGVNESGIGFGNSEGDGIYIARDSATAKFFSPDAKANAAYFKEPKNPFVVKNEPMYILNESDELPNPIGKSDSAWLKASKTAYQRAMKKTGGKWDADEVGTQLGKYLVSKGHDAIMVDAGNEAWTVLYDKSLALKGNYTADFAPLIEQLSAAVEALEADTAGAEMFYNENHDERGRFAGGGGGGGGRDGLRKVGGGGGSGESYRVVFEKPATYDGRRKITVGLGYGQDENGYTIGT